MARMLTEEEVEEIEKQRELQDRARAAGSTAGMSWIEKERLSQQQLNDRFKQAHADAMERRRLNVLADPAAEADTNYRHSVMRDAELRAAHERGMDVHRGEWDTRLKEAEERRRGLREQGSDAAKANSEAAIRAAELNAASAEKVATINKDRDLGVAEWGYKGKKDEGDAKVEVADIQGKATVAATQAQAQAQETRLYAENLMKMRNLDQRQALQFARLMDKRIDKLMDQNKRKLPNGTYKYSITREEARERIEKEMEEMGQMPGTAKKPLADFGV